MDTIRVTTILYRADNSNPLIINGLGQESRLSNYPQTTPLRLPISATPAPKIAPRARVLIFDLDIDYLLGRKFALEQRGHIVSACHLKEPVGGAQLVKRVGAADLVIFDLSTLNHDIWSIFRLVLRSQGPEGLPTRLSWSSRIDRGNEFARIIHGLREGIHYGR